MNNQIDLSEFHKLEDLLYQHNIPYDVRPFCDGLQLFYRNAKGNIVCDVVCHEFSYGYETGLLEIMGLVEKNTDEIEGWLTADEIFKRIVKYRKEVEEDD